MDLCDVFLFLKILGVQCHSLVVVSTDHMLLQTCVCSVKVVCLYTIPGKTKNACQYHLFFSCSSIVLQVSGSASFNAAPPARCLPPPVASVKNVG